MNLIPFGCAVVVVSRSHLWAAQPAVHWSVCSLFLEQKPPSSVLKSTFQEPWPLFHSFRNSSLSLNQRQNVWMISTGNQIAKQKIKEPSISLATTRLPYHQTRNHSEAPVVNKTNLKNSTAQFRPNYQVSQSFWFCVDYESVAKSFGGFSGSNWKRRALCNNTKKRCFAQGMLCRFCGKLKVALSSRKCIFLTLNFDQTQTDDKIKLYCMYRDRRATKKWGRVCLI